MKNTISHLSKLTFCSIITLNCLTQLFAKDVLDSFFELAGRSAVNPFRVAELYAGEDDLDYTKVLEREDQLGTNGLLKTFERAKTEEGGRLVQLLSPLFKAVRITQTSESDLQTFIRKTASQSLNTKGLVSAKIEIASKTAEVVLDLNRNKERLFEALDKIDDPKKLQKIQREQKLLQLKLQLVAKELRSIHPVIALDELVNVQAAARNIVDIAANTNAQSIAMDVLAQTTQKMQRAVQEVEEAAIEVEEARHFINSGGKQVITSFGDLEQSISTARRSRRKMRSISLKDGSNSVFDFKEFIADPDYISNNLGVSFDFDQLDVQGLPDIDSYTLEVELTNGDERLKDIEVPSGFRAVLLKNEYNEEIIILIATSIDNKAKCRVFYEVTPINALIWHGPLLDALVALRIQEGNLNTIFMIPDNLCQVVSIYLPM